MKNLGRIAFFGVLYLCAWSDPSHAGDTSADPGCEIATHEAHVGGGTLYYNTAGQGRRVLLLHGLFAQKEQWHGMLCLLAAAGYAGIAPDLPGYGKSHGFAVQDYALERQVALLHQLMASIRIEAFDLAGNSMGGTIAALYARQYPRQVRTLAFIGSPLGIVGWNQPVKEAIYQGINPFIPVDMQQVNLELDLLFVKPPSLAEAAKETAVIWPWASTVPASRRSDRR